MILTKRGKRIMLPVFWIAWVNFLIFWVVAVCIGGDAISGSVENDRYYLSEYGQKTEVSRSLYNYSYIHTVSVFITYPSVFIVGLVLLLSGDIRITPPVPPHP